MTNGAVHVVSTKIYNVMSSASDSELAELYLNEKYGFIIRNMIEKWATHIQQRPYRQKIHRIRHSQHNYSSKMIQINGHEFLLAARLG